MDIKAIRNGIVTELNNFLEVPVVTLEQNKPKPKYPFLTYKITTPYVKGFGMEVQTSKLIPSQNTNFEYDIEETIVDQPTFTISFTAYSKDSLESQELALKACNWFNHIGYYTLKNLDVVLVSIEAIGSRDTLIVDDYERRNGFDVILRTTHIVSRRVETIEDYSMEGEIK